MQATAKHDTEVTLYVDLNSLSFNTNTVKKGTVLNLEVYSDEKMMHPLIAKKLGERCVTFKNGGFLIPTYSKDFDYED